ncbi:TetR/AcrR family transcriptional regulator [Pelagibius sp. Alg239-R121]|uniref:TetR/AcrR family transcriptional regulator n=1 Tax=Pelagibius sp. Alg239-R121 TaxID=2993448 RepID=UPI0024A72AAF|nr:TetR/AcrR family transcriptional regulator [Pelagibius sp. Alg239-R121]
MARTKEFDIEQALERAMTAFWSHGFAGTSVHDLVEAMQIQRGSLYGTFGDKRTLFRLAYERYDERRQKGMDSKAPPTQAIRAWFARLVDEGCAENGTRGCFIVNTALELEMHDDAMRETVAKSLQSIETFFFDNIEAGQRDGSINTGVDARKTAQSMLSSVIGLRVLSRSRPERPLLQNIADSAISPIL